MKKIWMLLLLCAGCCVAVPAAGGTASDPLVSLSYLKNSFTADFLRQAEEKLDETEKTVSAYLEQELAPLSPTGTVGDCQRALSFTECALNRGDTLTMDTGGNLIPLAGGISAAIEGVCVDVTLGKELSGTVTLTANHRYMVAEDSAVQFSATGKTAVTQICGDYTLTRSTQTDWRALADALNRLTLFRGTNRGYGNGYDLEEPLTREQALVMLIRLLGEEDEALASTADIPFTDALNHWSRSYIAYAYEKGYTNGMNATSFGIGVQASANMYVEFVLRALGYSSTATTDINDAPERACSDGVLTSAEVELLRSEAFLRADAVYLSYYALSTQICDSSQTLAQRLIADGVFTRSDYRSAQKLVTVERIQ